MKNFQFETNYEFAKKLDAKDTLHSFRSQFHIPEVDGKQAAYFCGNSLGLQPKSAASYIQQELDDWSRLGVIGHVKAKNPWVSYHKMLSGPLANITGAYPHEVVAMNSLTTNLHLMLSSFYRPSISRYKIITEAGSFSSDIYALESQVKSHGLTPEECIIEVKPRTEESLIDEEDILRAIHTYGNELSLVLLGGVNYYTGQAFDMKAIAAAAHKVGAFVGYDLAHAIGNIPLSLHLWEADFAVWCSYKYLNGGPGGVGGAFIHEKYGNNRKFPRLAGWWAHNEQDRFTMPRHFNPQAGAEGFQLSNAPVLSMAALRSSLDIFEKAGAKNIFAKSKMLTNYLEFLITSQCRVAEGPSRWKNYQIKIISPRSEEKRGAQLSILIMENGQELYQNLVEENFIVDWRSPGVIRVSPVPLYNTYEEVFRFAKILSTSCCHV